MAFLVFCNTVRPLLTRNQIVQQRFSNYATILGCACKQVPCKMPIKDTDIKYYPQNFFDRMFNRRRVRKRPPPECCKIRACLRNPQCEKIPEFIKEMAKNTPGCSFYRTPGTAYIMEVPRTAGYKCSTKSKTDLLVSKIEAHHENRTVEDIHNPMPDSCNPCVRMIDLEARKLHPLYKKYEFQRPQKRKYVDMSKSDILIKTIKHPSELLKGKMLLYPKKKVFIDFKMAELPRYMAYKMVATTFTGMDIRINTRKECKEHCKFNFTVCPPPDCDDPKFKKTKKKE